MGSVRSRLLKAVIWNDTSWHTQERKHTCVMYVRSRLVGRVIWLNTSASTQGKSHIVVTAVVKCSLTQVQGTDIPNDASTFSDHVIPWTAATQLCVRRVIHVMCMICVVKPIRFFFSYFFCFSHVSLDSKFLLRKNWNGCIGGVGVKNFSASICYWNLIWAHSISNQMYFWGWLGKYPCPLKQ